MAFDIEGKEMYTAFVFAKFCWSVHSKVGRLGKHAHSKQRKATPTQPLQFHIKFMCMTCQFSIYRVNFFNISLANIGNGSRNDVEKAQKLIKIYQFYRAEENNQ